MITYAVSLQTHILTMDDINLICFCKRIDQSKNESTFTIFRKIANLFQLTNNNAKSIIAMAIMSTEIAQAGPKLDEKNKDRDLMFGLLYKKLDNQDIYYIEPMISTNIDDATIEFDRRVNSYENIDKESIIVSQIGQFVHSEENETLKDSRYIITVEEKEMSKIFIRESYDSLNEFNRKIYKIDLNKEVINK